MKLDHIDRKILTALQRDGRLQNIELARKVGLSPSPCLRRVKLLEEAGIIERYSAQLNAAKIGMGFTVFARVWLASQDAETVNGFTEAVRGLAQVIEVPGCGHAPALNVPAQYELVDQFLARAEHHAAVPAH